MRIYTDINMTGPRVRSRLRGVLIGLALLAVGVAASSAGKWLVVSRPLAYPDAIISLASHEWERLPVTARLASAAPSALVLLTLPQPVTRYNCHDCSGRVSLLQRLGVPSDRVRILPIASPGTHGEALATRAFARQAHIRRLLIVTTPYHTRRSLATFRSVFDGSGLEIGIEPATVSSPARPERWWAAPYDRAYVAYEWAALIYYAVWHHVAVWSWSLLCGACYIVSRRSKVKSQEANSARITGSPVPPAGSTRTRLRRRRVPVA